MKKITFTLLASITLLGSAYSQATYNKVAPPNDNVTSSFKPLNGLATHASQRSVVYINEFELLPMNLSSITSVGFQYLGGTGSIPVTGNFTLYLENTNDIEMDKPNSFSAITATMINSYVGTYIVPAAAGPATVNITISSPFNYTGGGLYVAWDFDSTGPFAAATASLSNNSDNTDSHYYNFSSAAPQNTFSIGVFRPSLIFNAINTATNEIELIEISAPGKVAKLFGTPEDINTYVVNSSIGAQTNVSVTLNVTGANPYSNSQVIPSLAAGATATLNWTGYNPTVNGTSTITAAVLFSDQNLINNTKSWTQSVTCSSMNVIAPSFTLGTGYGFNTSGIFAAMYNIPGTASLTAINAVIGSDASNSGKQVYGVLADSNGNIIAVSNNTPNIASGATVALNFNLEPLTANTDYLFGIAQPVTGFFPAAFTKSSRYAPSAFYTMPLAGGAPTQFNNFVSFGIEPVLDFDATQISASASKTLVCKGNTVTLSATGLSTYTWTPGGVGSSIVVTPTVAGTTGTGTAIYNVIGTDATSGCKSVSKKVNVIISLCTGLADNSLNGYNINVFPNPAVNGKSTVNGLVGTNVITVYNTLGQVVLNQTVSTETTEIDLSNQASGNYIVKITDSNSESRIIKLVNQN